MASRQKRDSKGRFAGDFSGIRAADKAFGKLVDQREAVIKRVSRGAKEKADIAADKMSKAFAAYKKSPTEKNRQKWLQAGKNSTSAMRTYNQTSTRARQAMDAKRPLPRAPGAQRQPGERR